MGLSSFFNPDILIGMGQARQKERENLLSQEAERRKSGTQLLSKIFESPDLTPEAREVVLNKLATATMLEPGKPDPKGLFSLDDVLNVRPQVGRSVSRTQSQELPDVGANQYGLTPSSLGLGASELRAPEAPADYRRSGFYSPEERQSQEIDRYRQQQQVMTQENIKRTRAEQLAQQEFAPPTPPEHFAFGAEQGIAERGTGRIIREPQAKVTPPNLTNLSRNTVIYNGKPTDVLEDLDPASPSKGKVFLQTATGLQDITGQTSHYRPPPQSVGVGGLSTPVSNAAQRVASQFDSNPVVRQYNEAILRAANVNDIMNAKWSGPGDMAMVFEFMRSLDPTSVVRESEYETARKTGNWFKGAFAKFNGLFNPEGGFLSDQVKRDFNSVLQSKMKQASTQVKNIYNDFGRRIDNITGVKGSGLDYLTDYTTMLPQPIESPDANMVRVQIPGQPPGLIPNSALQQFLKDNPGATQLK